MGRRFLISEVTLQVVVSKEEAEGPWQRGVVYKGFVGD